MIKLGCPEHFLAQSGHGPDAFSDTTLIAVEITATGRQMPSSAAGYSPDAVSYTTLIRALSWQGRSADALQAFKDLDANPNAQADLYAYNAVISALSVAGRMEDAEEFLRRASQLAQQQSEPAPVEAFGAIIKVGHQNKPAVWLATPV